MRIDFMPELKRRYGGSIEEDIKSLLAGKSSPFTYDSLVKRHKEKNVRGGSYEKFLEMFTIIWDAGIIGIQASPNGHSPRSYLDEINSILGHKTYRNYTPLGSNRSMHRWFLFEYNFDLSPQLILKTFENRQDTSISLVVHPAVNEYFGATVNSEVPIG